MNEEALAHWGLLCQKQTSIIQPFNVTTRYSPNVTDEDMRMCVSIKHFFLSTKSMRTDVITGVLISP